MDKDKDGQLNLDELVGGSCVCGACPISLLTDCDAARSLRRRGQEDEARRG